MLKKKRKRVFFLAYAKLPGLNHWVNENVVFVVVLWNKGLIHIRFLKRGIYLPRLFFYMLGFC